MLALRSRSGSPMTRVRCYVDGLNFHYGVSQAYGVEWIDLEKLLGRVLAAHLGEAVEIERVLLFISPPMEEAAQHSQAAYLEALRRQSLCHIQVVPGSFQERAKRGPMVLARDGRGKVAERGRIVEISVWEEKRTDVNLACMVVHDGHMRDKAGAAPAYDLACLVSNDDDLSIALEIKRRLRQRVLLLSPRSEASSTKVAGGLKRLVPRDDRIPCVKRADVMQALLPGYPGGPG